MNSMLPVPPNDSEERLRFEMLLTELSARFANATPESINNEIINAQKQIVQALNLDRSALAQFQGPEQLVVTHSWAVPDIKPMPGFVIKDIPWLRTTVGVHGEEVRFARIDDLPEEAGREKEIFRRFGPRSSAIFPFKVSGKIIGAMAFGTVVRERDWPDSVVNRLRLFVELIGNGIARTRAEEATRKAWEEVRRLRERLERANPLQQEAKAVRGRSTLIGESATLRRVLAQVEQVAPTNSNVLLIGETGTGKEIVASAIHELSVRSSRPMVRVNCAAIPDTLIESELFGREKGAYTGAMSRQVGRFELAHGSTLFLDEVGELPMGMQAKLLRVLEEKRVERLGSPKSILVDVRIIAATNRDLEKAVRAKQFRDDLFYRLNVFPIRTPALKERPEDIPLLVQSFAHEFAMSMGKNIEEVDEDSIAALQRYSWPGNIRELRNIVERAVIMSTGPQLQIAPPDTDAPAYSLLHVDVEREHVRGVLEMTGWRVRGKSGAAQLLGLKPTTLDSMILRLGLTRIQKGKPS
jgi:formate hydrogenlyase transcriptional activator